MFHSIRGIFVDTKGNLDEQVLAATIISVVACYFQYLQVLSHPELFNIKDFCWGITAPWLGCGAGRLMTSKGDAALGGN